jgi:kynurenine formamidase
MKIIDLSQNIENGQLVYPGVAKTLINTWNTFEETAHFHGSGRVEKLYTTCALFMSDHCSTHIDALIHFSEQGKTSEHIPLEYCCGDGIAFDFSFKKPRESITFRDIEEQLKKSQLEIRERDIVLIHTGASKYWGSAKYLEYIVSLEEDTIRQLCRMGVKVIGVDEISIDTTPPYPAHLLTNEFEWYHIENLTNIDKIKSPRFKFFGLPLKLVGASAAPMRAIAISEE